MNDCSANSKPIVCLAAFRFSRAQSYDTTIFPDDPDLKPSEGRNVCYTPECIRTASRVLSYMNASLDPCDNFYKFACGKFMNTNLLHGVNSVNQFSLNEAIIRRKIMDYLQNETLPTSPRYARLIKTFHSSCIDYFNKAKERILNSVMDFMNKTNGWPLLKNDSWEYENYQWEKFDYKTENMEILSYNFIHFTTTFIFLKYSIPKHWLIEQPEKFFITQELYNSLLFFGQLLGVEKNDVENSLKQMFEVNDKLDGIYESRDDYNYLIPKRMTVEELMEEYPNISWKEFLNMRLKPNMTADDNVIYVRYSSYFEKLNTLIPTISKRDQANYLMWRIIYQYLESYLDLLNTKNYPFEICYNSTANNFYKALGFLYVKNNFNNDSFPKYIDDMYHNIQEEFSTILKNNSWLDNETKLKALEKLESIVVESPKQYLFYDKEIDEHYEYLEITPGDYLHSLLNITKFNKYYKGLIHSVSSSGYKKHWENLLDATIINARYEDAQNLIILLPGIFQGVFFDQERPQYMNYGSIGSTIAHEMSHAFDSEGRKYDKYGSRVNWWTPEANAIALRKAQCIINQHNRYRVEEVGLNLNGYRTQNEDIGDYVGIKVAYSAYEKYMETHGLEQLLPNVNYTQRQLFWISYAQRQCAIVTTKVLEDTIKKEQHSTPEFRVIGPLSNSLTFAKDFQCAPNTKMNPEDKCTFW